MVFCSILLVRYCWIYLISFLPWFGILFISDTFNIVTILLELQTFLKIILLTPTVYIVFMKLFHNVNFLANMIFWIPAQTLQKGSDTKKWLWCWLQSTILDTSKYLEMDYISSLIFLLYSIMYDTCDTQIKIIFKA